MKRQGPPFPLPEHKKANSTVQEGSSRLCKALSLLVEHLLVRALGHDDVTRVQHVHLGSTKQHASMTLEGHGTRKYIKNRAETPRIASGVPPLRYTREKA